MHCLMLQQLKQLFSLTVLYLMSHLTPMLSRCQIFKSWLCFVVNKKQWKRPWLKHSKTPRHLCYRNTDSCWGLKHHQTNPGYLLSLWYSLVGSGFGFQAIAVGTTTPWHFQHVHGSTESWCLVSYWWHIPNAVSLGVPGYGCLELSQLLSRMRSKISVLAHCSFSFASQLLIAKK